MTALRFVRLGPVLAALALASTVSAVSVAAELDKYRDFSFGSSLATIAKQAAMDPSEAKVIHRRPALIQELAWRPQPLGWSSRSEAAQAVVFSFYNGELFALAIDYDRYETEGMTPDDLIEAISAKYGKASKPAAPVNTIERLNGEKLEVLARWEDAKFRFDLLSRSSYGLTYRLTGVVKQLHAAAQAVTAEALRLDGKEAPQRDAIRVANELNEAKAKSEKARLLNKPKFRP